MRPDPDPTLELRIADCAEQCIAHIVKRTPGAENEARKRVK
jgi:hypothetical protein